MDILQAIVLGVVQGLAEFLPISSSGHLIMVPFLLGWSGQSLAYDVALHLGTAAALVWYFWRDWTCLAVALARGILYRAARALLASGTSARGGGGWARSVASRDDWASPPAWRLAWLVILGSIPAGVVGLVFERYIEEHFRDPALNAMLLIVFALILLAADRLGARNRPMERTMWSDALAVGCAQALALFPGVSRSGVTITAGLLLGLERSAAARFSFLLSGPIVIAAAIFKLRDGLPPGEADTVIVGIVASAITGWLAIGFLLRFLQRYSVLPFVVYRVVFGLVMLAVALG